MDYIVKSSSRKLHQQLAERKRHHEPQMTALQFGFLLALPSAATAAGWLRFALIIPLLTKVGDVVEAQRRRIVLMLLKGDIYGLPGSDGTVSHIAPVDLLRRLRFVQGYHVAHALVSLISTDVISPGYSTVLSMCNKK